MHRRLSGDHYLIALQRCEGAADDALGPIGRRSVDEIDAEIDGFEDETGGLVFRLAGFEAQPAKAAAAEAGHADTQLGAPQSGILHCWSFSSDNNDPNLKAPRSGQR